MTARIAIGLLWLLHFLPLPTLAHLGAGLGRIAYFVVPSRRRVCLTNLALCFPQMPRRERTRLARRAFAALGRGVVDHGVLWWGSRERIARMVRVEGLDALLRLVDAGTPVILFAPHFVGLGAGATRLSMERPAVSMYSRQKDAYLNAALARYRNRFEPVTLLSRQDGVRALAREIRRGKPCYYLPDLDFGPRDSVFVPFFGVPAATTPALARLARLAGARVVPVVTAMEAGGRYVTRIEPPWEGFPTGDDAADARRMNAFIEARALEIPEQYHWLHKRFKTRPPGATRLYSID